MHLVDRLLPQRCQEFREAGFGTSLQTPRLFGSHRNPFLVLRDPRMLEILHSLKLAADSPVPILLFGESGVGKDVLAEYVHSLFRGGNTPFVAVSCGEIPASLMQSELFGHEKGSFTGASHERKGALTRAAGGVLFLDEIGHIDTQTQAALLRALDPHGTFNAIGSEKPMHSSFKLITATSQNPFNMLRDDILLRPFYHRINGCCIEVPPLAQRPADILALTSHYLGHIQRRQNPEAENPEFSGAVKKGLVALPWPGNVRQLMMFCESLQIRAAQAGNSSPSDEDFLTEISKAREFENRAGPMRDATYFPKVDYTRVRIPTDITRDEFLNLEHHVMRQMLESGMLVTEIATHLGCSERTVYRNQQRMLENPQSAPPK